MAKGYQNIEMRLSPSDEELRGLIRWAKATIYIPVDEGLWHESRGIHGMRHASNRVNDGGLKESIVDGQSGILIDAECQPNDIINAISHINTSPLDATSCVQRGEYFSLKSSKSRSKTS